MIKRHHQLSVWKKSMELAEEVSSLSKQLPQKERFGLTSQLRRCGVSVPSNMRKVHHATATKSFYGF